MQQNPANLASRTDSANAVSPSRWDVRQLALAVLADAKIINRPAELDEKAADSEDVAKKTACIAPPWCLWPLPSSTERKASSNKANQQMAPSARFLGAPLPALKAAGISESQVEAEAIAADPERMYETMRRVRDCGGYLYGNLWTMARFAFNVGVDTSDLQRLFEWTVDELSVRNYQFLKNYLLGLDRPVIRIHSKREARQLVTSIEEPASSRSAWNKLAHPTFFTFTKQHEGPVTSETIGELRVFEHVTQNFVAGEDRRAGKAQYCDLEPSRVTVALAVGQVMRMSAVIGDPEQKLFNLEGIKILKAWLWSLSDRERRLARHLILSPGDRKGYKYLLEYAYAATVLGTRVVDDRRYRHKAVKDLQTTAARLLERVTELPLVNVCVHLRAAIASLGTEVKAIPLTPTPKGMDCPPLGLEEEDINLPESATGLPKSVTDLKSDLPKSVTDLPKSVTNLPKSVTLMHVTAPFSDTWDLSNSKKSSVEIISNQISSEQASADETQGETEQIGTDRIGSVVVDSKRHVEEVFSLKSKPSQIQAQLPLEEIPSKCQGMIPAGWESLETWLDLNAKRTLPQQLLDGLFSVGLTAGQVDKIQKQGPLSVEAMWAIHQALLRDGKGLNKPAGTLYNALLIPDNARKWLIHAGPTLRKCGWFEELTDGTSREPSARKDLTAMLQVARYRRMPLSAEQQKEAEVLRQGDRRAESAATIRLDKHLLNVFDEGLRDPDEDENSMDVPNHDPVPSTADEALEPEVGDPIESLKPCAEVLPQELPEALRFGLAAIKRALEDLQGRKREITRAALSSKNSSAVLTDPDYIACNAGIREQLDEAKAQLGGWGGRIRTTTGLRLDFRDKSAVAESELLTFLHTCC